MKRSLRLLMLALFAALGPRDASAQIPSATREDFLEGAARAAARYADRREALADGFRRLGPDFPGMGVHWVQTGRVVSGVLIAERPAVLCYIERDGAPILVGLAYTLPLGPAESPPEEPFGVGAWHDHSSEVSEESLLLDHPATVSAEADGFRLSMLHVWIPLQNPAGIVAQNNWTLPFLRVGLEPPRSPSLQAARGLSLGAGGIEFYRELLLWALPADEASDVYDAVLSRWATQADAWIARRSSAEFTEEDLHELEAIWAGVWADLERSMRPETFAKIAPLRGGGAGTPRSH